ncbi:SemiSWEET transporter [Jeongeupia chitinilytica]|uniref:Sugar transporter SemiSWEET n=1 Tax=Jeongeupia chitinilytica TaxID=1041641 RepID=A0ABQ3H0G4_9NEIS|nr:SemiSWEET transporter [Jeongeupia chitinilytica]GHD60248.1 sugar transporter SemiSWEET [Jeongeupia chitinilytica]
MNPLDWIGHVAGVCTTFAFLPQVVKVWRTRSVDDISLGMYSLFVFGVALWLLYGVVISSWPLIIPNSITLVLAGSVLAMKLRYSVGAKR